MMIDGLPSVTTKMNFGNGLKIMKLKQLKNNIMKQHELNELCKAQRHEINTLRRTINEQNKDIIKKDRLISNLAKKVNNKNKQLI